MSKRGRSPKTKAVERAAWTLDDDNDVNDYDENNNNNNNNNNNFSLSKL